MGFKYFKLIPNCAVDEGFRRIVLDNKLFSSKILYISLNGPILRQKHPY